MISIQQLYLYKLVQYLVPYKQEEREISFILGLYVHSNLKNVFNSKLFHTSLKCISVFIKTQLKTFNQVFPGFYMSSLARPTGVHLNIRAGTTFAVLL